MNNTSFHNGLFINDYHRQSSMAAMREVLMMSFHPYSRVQKIQQIKSLRDDTHSKSKTI